MRASLAKVTVGQSVLSNTGAAIRAIAGGTTPDGIMTMEAVANGTFNMYGSTGEPAFSGGTYGSISKFANATITNPFAGGAVIRSTVTALKDPSYRYIGGAQILADPNSSDRYLFYHFEKWPSATPPDTFSLDYWSGLGVAKGTAGGNTWIDLGAIITPDLPYADPPNWSGGAEVGSGTFVVSNGYILVYHQSRSPASVNPHTFTCLARCTLSSFLTSGAAGTAPVFYKYYQGAFLQPGLGGHVDSLLPGNPVVGFHDVQYHSEAKVFVMSCQAASETFTTDYTLQLRQSLDGVTWSVPVTTVQASSSTELLLYGTMVSVGGNETRTLTNPFNILYTRVPANIGFDGYEQRYVTVSLSTEQVRRRTGVIAGQPRELVG